MNGEPTGRVSRIGARPPVATLARAVALAAMALPGGLSGFLTGSLVGQEPGRLTGRVVESEGAVPVAGATIFIQGTTRQASTDDLGRFVLADIPIGRHDVRVIAPGFLETFVRDIVIEPGREARIDVRLETAIFDVPDIVVTASRGLTRPGDAPVSVAVMTDEELRRRNVVSLAEALPFAQGVIFNSGQMDIRGATGLARGVGSRVLMLLDGHRVLSGVGASIEFDALPVLDVERIEIVKGPHSTLYGTNALGGVVNIITKRPPREPETIVRAYYGLFDTPSDLDFTEERLSSEGLNLQHSRRIGDVGTTLFLGRESSDGFRQNGNSERWKLRMKTVFPVESANPWELFVNWTREDEEEFFTWLSEERPLEVDPEELGDWTREDDLTVGLTAHPVVTPRLRLQVRPHVYHARVQNHFHDNEDFHRSTRYGADTQLSLYPSLSNAVTVGAEAALTEVTSDFLSEPTVRDLALFAQDELEVAEDVKATLGVRLDYHKASTAERDLQLNPKIGLVFQPSARLSVRVSASRGYRAPSVSEQFTNTTQFGFRVLPNLELRGESAWAGEIGATASVGSWLWLDAGAFWSEYDDLIEPAPIPNQFFTFQFQNVSEARVRGLDTGVRVSLVPDQLSLGVNYTFLDTEDKRVSLPLPYRSRHNLTATLDVWEERVGIDFRYRSKVEQVLAFPLDPRSGIAIVDLRLGYELFGTEVRAKVENLFQNEYVDVQERNPGQTRSFFLSLSPRF